MKRKQKVITKRQLVKMLDSIEACWKGRQRVGTVRQLFNRARKMDGLGWLSTQLGLRIPDECACRHCEDDIEKAFRKLNRAALAYCRRHNIK